MISDLHKAGIKKDSQSKSRSGNRPVKWQVPCFLKRQCRCMVRYLGMGTVYIAMHSVEQVAAEVQICTKTLGIPAANIHVNQSNCNTPLQLHCQDKPPLPFLSPSNKVHA